jgi:hypothetical protein
MRRARPRYPASVNAFHALLSERRTFCRRAVPTLAAFCERGVGLPTYRVVVRVDLRMAYNTRFFGLVRTSARGRGAKAGHLIGRPLWTIPCGIVCWRVNFVGNASYPLIRSVQHYTDRIRINEDSEAPPVSSSSLTSQTLMFNLGTIHICSHYESKY